MSSVYNMLCSFIGKLSEKFDWQVRDKKNKFTRYENIKPIDFYKKFVNVKLTVLNVFSVESLFIIST